MPFHLHPGASTKNLCLLGLLLWPLHQCSFEHMICRGVEVIKFMPPFRYSLVSWIINVTLLRIAKAFLDQLNLPRIIIPTFCLFPCFLKDPTKLLCIWPFWKSEKHLQVSILYFHCSFISVCSPYSMGFSFCVVTFLFQSICSIIFVVSEHHADSLCCGPLFLLSSSSHFDSVQFDIWAISSCSKVTY